jgi:hypothetical protein
MIPPQYGYKLGNAWNLPAGSCTNVEAISAGGQYFYPPSAYSAYNPGSVKLRVDGQVYNTGFASVDWKFDTLFRDQWRYLQQNYTFGGNSYSGTVTAVTLNPAGTYAPYNAVLILPNLPQLERNFVAYRNVIVKLTRLGQS